MHKTPRWLMWLYPNLVWHKERDAKRLYLTFDDGPVPGPTEFVLETLADYRAKATFFCVGENIQRHPDLFAKALEQGHTLGNHTFNHRNGWKSDTDSYLENVAAGKEALFSHGRGRVRHHLFRPPYGRIKRAQAKVLGKEADIIMWDVLSGDFDARLEASECLRHSIRGTSPGSIIVFHDSVKSEERLRYVLPRYLDHFAKEGYAFEGL